MTEDEAVEAYQLPLRCQVVPVDMLPRVLDAYCTLLQGVGGRLIQIMRYGDDRPYLVAWRGGPEASELPDPKTYAG